MGLFSSQIFRRSLFIKIQLKCRYKVECIESTGCGQLSMPTESSRLRCNDSNHSKISFKNMNVYRPYQIYWWLWYSHWSFINSPMNKKGNTGTSNWLWMYCWLVSNVYHLLPWLLHSWPHPQNWQVDGLLQLNRKKDQAVLRWRAKDPSTGIVFLLHSIVLPPVAMLLPAHLLGVCTAVHRDREKFTTCDNVSPSTRS